VFVCLSVRDHIFGTTRMSDLHQIFVHVTYDRGSVILWRCSDMLCTSGFIDDVIGQGCCSTSPPSWSAVHTALNLAINGA